MYIKCFSASSLSSLNLRESVFFDDLLQTTRPVCYSYMLISFQGPEQSKKLICFKMSGFALKKIFQYKGLVVI